MTALAGSWAVLEQLLGQMVRMRSEMEPHKEEELELAAAVAEDGGERAAAESADQTAAPVAGRRRR